MAIATDMAGVFVDVTPQGDSTFNFDKAFKAEIKNFVDSSVGLDVCRAPGEDGLALMKILDAIYESAQTGKSVDID